MTPVRCCRPSFHQPPVFRVERFAQAIAVDVCPPTLRDEVSLDYAGVKAAVKALGLSFAKVFDGVRVLEDEVLGALSER